MISIGNHDNNGNIVFGEEWRKSSFQRVYEYLRLYETNKPALHTFDYKHGTVNPNVADVLGVLLR